MLASLFILLSCQLYRLHSFHSIPPLKKKLFFDHVSYFKSFSNKDDNQILSTVYNPIEIEKKYNSQPIEVWERLVDIGSPLLGWWLLRKWDNITSIFHSVEENQIRLNHRAEDLKNAIVQSKSITLIKSGQALALRPDIVKSPEYIRELQKLQDEVGTFDNDVAMDIIKNELGCDADELYEFDPKLPIASASIGQVYRAKLKANEKIIAVKVQRPDALPSSSLDMYLLRKLAAYVKKEKKLRTDLVGVADEFGKQLFCELNYIQEGRNCIRFKGLYGNISGIYVPDVYMNLTTKRVLTMEFVEGVKGPWPTGGEKMLTIGLQCSVLQLLDTGYFHADPHRGNLLQTPDGKLAYLDFGMMADVPSAKRYGLIGTVLGLVNKDISMVVQNLKDLDFFPPDTDTEVIVSALNSAVFNSTVNGRGSTLNFTRLSQNLDSISYLLPVRLPPFYTLIIRTLTILEGLALFVDPDFRLIRGAYPFIAKQILTSSSPELAQLLRAVIVNDQGRIRWDKLEQFISISSNADAAVAGDFEALKRAQVRSDIRKVYSNEEVGGNVTVEVATQILTFLLSENGKVLRVPLVAEIADTLESLGLAAIALSSIATNGFIPKPDPPPDQQRVEQFVSLLQLAADKLASSGASSTAIPTSDSAATLATSGCGANASKMVSTLQYLFNAADGPLLSSFPSLVALVSPIVTEVIALIVERSSRRIVRRLFSPENLQSLLPLVGPAVFDLAAPFLRNNPKKQSGGG